MYFVPEIRVLLEFIRNQILIFLAGLEKHLVPVKRLD
jgi:hypothetical protein